jgi:hypothetical protein
MARASFKLSDGRNFEFNRNGVQSEIRRFFFTLAPLSISPDGRPGLNTSKPAEFKPLALEDLDM